MKHGNVWVLMGAAAVIALLMAVFAPRPASPKEYAPVLRSDRDGIVIAGGRALIDVNRADAMLLSELPGIGESLAQAIIDGRPYASAEDLLLVKGIGEAKLAGLRDFIAISGD